MRTAINEDMFTPDVIADPYAYYGRLRDEVPVYWNELYQLWVVSSYEHVVWLTRHHELFSSAVFKNDPRPAYPDINESDLGLYEYVRQYQADQFIQHDRPEHLEMRKVVHGYFTPKSMEAWRPFVQSAIKDLLDEAEAKGRMDVMRDFATPLPVLVIAQMMGVPREDRAYVRHLAEKLLNIGRGEPDRMQPLTEGMQGMIDYVSPLVDERLVNPGDDFISVLAQGEKAGVFTRHQVLVNTSLLLLAGHETTINLLCNGTLAFIRHPEQWALLKQDPAGRTVRATEECLRYDAPVKSIQRIASQDVEMHGAKTIVSGGSFPPPIGIPRHSRHPTPLTSAVIRTRMWPLAPASITASAPPLRDWKARKRSRPWPSASPTCNWKRRRWSISRASPSGRSSLYL
jgi:cytochrome P450